MKKIVERIIAQGETALAAEAVARDRHGLIDGVAIDFRHPDLPNEWLPRPQWYVCGSPPTNLGAIFPSEAAELAEDRELFADKPAAIQVRAGDRLSVERVVPQIADGRLDHPHDAQVRLAYLKLERPSGEALGLPEPLGFYGVTQVRDGPTREAFDHILERICASAGVETIHGGEWSSWDAPLERTARRFGATAHDAYFRLAALLSGDEQGLGQLRALANNAALAGFLLAKAEMRRAETIALAAERNRQQGTAAVTRFDWREKARAIWAEHPEYTPNRVATMIADGTDDDISSIARGIKKLRPSI